AVDIIGVVGLVLSLLLSSIAAISLFVGGIGIMNIMLVSVTERTKEIGLRKAVGATRKEILEQFLAEAIILTLLGGLIGVAAGILLSAFIAYVVSVFIDGWVFYLPITAIILALLISSIVGIVFGVYPARRASLLDPIYALRYE
ncbi:FtsX-like permease family protein, partial [Candidatus Parcubacteria bacterium]